MALLAAFLTPWARPTNLLTGRKVVVRSYGIDACKKLIRKVS
ncbi:MAG TPA: hypothetical protein VF373_06765 [Prolixibacteraceae bacterium]